MSLGKYLCSLPQKTLYVLNLIIELKCSASYFNADIAL